uniref:Putative secreted protein n=1 Tax=Anopheles marajoara TaxID=58244 RepID=A0A2M4C6I2_9DIPT
MFSRETFCISLRSIILPACFASITCPIASGDNSGLCQSWGRCFTFAVGADREVSSIPPVTGPELAPAGPSAGPMAGAWAARSRYRLVRLRCFIVGELLPLWRLEANEKLLEVRLNCIGSCINRHFFPVGSLAETPERK